MKINKLGLQANLWMCLGWILLGFNMPTLALLPFSIAAGLFLHILWG